MGHVRETSAVPTVLTVADGAGMAAWISAAAAATGVSAAGRKGVSTAVPMTRFFLITGGFDVHVVHGSYDKHAGWDQDSYFADILLASSAL